MDSLNDNKKLEDYMNKFIDGDNNEKMVEDKQFTEYCKLYEEKFGKYPKMREPGGTIEETINAIKICLEEDEDILEELIFEQDILNEKWFYAKRIVNYKELEQNLLKAVIYYIIAIRNNKEYNLDAIFRILSYDRKFLKHYLEELPSEHLAIQNFQKLSYLSDKEYKNIANAIKEKIAEIMSIYYDERRYCFEELFESEKDVEKYVNEILEDKEEGFIQ